MIMSGVATSAYAAVKFVPCGSSSGGICTAGGATTNPSSPGGFGGHVTCAQPGISHCAASGTISGGGGQQGGGAYYYLRNWPNQMCRKHMLTIF